MGGILYMKHMRNALPENMKGKYHSRDLGTDRRIILKWILKKQSVD
jgi:hypothetical protein